jgi:hypothetical protein
MKPLLNLIAARLRVPRQKLRWYCMPSVQRGFPLKPTHLGLCVCGRGGAISGFQWHP